MGNRIGAMLAALAASHAVSGCVGHGCDDVGCGGQGVGVYAATEPVSDLKAGATYRTEVVADGQLLACELTLPDETLCEDARPLLVVALPNGVTGNIGALGIHMGTTPKTLEVWVSRDGVEIGHDSYTLEYTHSRVGRGDCEQECWSSPGRRLS